MSSWLSLALTALCGVVAVHRGLHREAPASVMAAGMAAMSLDMAATGPTLMHGPWWAAGFAVVAVWPLLRPNRRGRVSTVGTQVAHLLCGLAMIYMCALPTMPAMDDVTAAAGSAHPTPAPTGHAMAGMGPVDLPVGPAAVPGPLGGAMALLGWALSCYFLLSTITTLTRRTASPSRLAVLDEAAVGLATAVMLVAVV